MGQSRPSTLSTYALHALRRAARLRREPDDREPGVMELLVELNEIRHVVPARRAGGRPKIDQHDFAAQVVGRERPLGIQPATASIAGSVLPTKGCRGRGRRIWMRNQRRPPQESAVPTTARLSPRESPVTALVPTLCVGTQVFDALRRGYHPWPTVAKRVAGSSTAERLGSAFPRGAWERVWLPYSIRRRRRIIFSTLRSSPGLKPTSSVRSTM